MNRLQTILFLLFLTVCSFTNGQLKLPKLISEGALFKSAKKKGNKLIVSFTNTGSGLWAKGSDSLHHFSIAGKDKNFVWAKAEIKGDKVIVWNESITNPVFVRYAWADNPEGANLYNYNGLPASPFEAVIR